MIYAKFTERAVLKDIVKKELLQGLFELLKNLKYWPIPVVIYGFGIILFVAIYIKLKYGPLSGSKTDRRNWIQMFL